MQKQKGWYSGIPAWHWCVVYSRSTHRCRTIYITALWYFCIRCWEMWKQLALWVWNLDSKRKGLFHFSGPSCLGRRKDPHDSHPSRRHSVACGICTCPVYWSQMWYWHGSQVVESFCRFGSQASKWWLVDCWLDANACLASESSEHFSMLDASDGGTAGEFFEKFVQDSNLFVPSTFSHIHEGDSWHGKHPKGKRKRIDFILTSMSLCSWCLKTFVCLDFDSGFAHEDHLPVVLELKGTCFVPEARPRLDEGKMIDPVLMCSIPTSIEDSPSSTLVGWCWPTCGHHEESMPTVGHTIL